MKKIITILAVVFMMFGFASCSKKDKVVPTQPQQEHPYDKLQSTVWQGTDNSNGTTVILSFGNYPDGSFTATNTSGQNTAGQIIWKMTGINVSADLYVSSNLLTSFYGTFEDNRLILNGIIMTRR